MQLRYQRQCWNNIELQMHDHRRYGAHGNKIYDPRLLVASVLNRELRHRKQLTPIIPCRYTLSCVHHSPSGTDLYLTLSEFAISIIYQTR